MSRPSAPKKKDPSPLHTPPKLVARARNPVIFNPVCELAERESKYEGHVSMYYAGKEVRVVSSLSAEEENDDIVDMSNIAD